MQILIACIDIVHPQRCVLFFFTIGVLPEVSLERKRKTEASLSELMDNGDAKLGTKVCKEMKGLSLSCDSLGHHISY